MENKRRVSALIPYKKRKDNEIVVFLQKRDRNKKRLPDYFGFFGGGAENNENPEQTLKREIMEEMNFTPRGYEHRGQYNFERTIMDIFVLEVSDDFESKIQVNEGEYGRYFTKEEISSEPKLIEDDKAVLRDFFTQKMIKYK